MNPEHLPEFYANVIDSVGDGVIVLDRDGQVILMNPVAEELAGVSRRISLGQLFTVLFKEDTLLLEMASKSSSSGMSISDHENIVLKRGGRITPLSVTVSPLLLGDGSRAGTIVLLKDLTNVIAQSDAGILEIGSRLDEARGMADIRLRVRVNDFSQLSQLLARLDTVPGVQDARRLG